MPTHSPSPGAQVTIYHGGFQAGWSSSSFGASVESADPLLHRSGSPESLFVKVAPYAALTLAATTPFNSSTVLNSWIKGSALTRAKFYLADSASLRSSPALALYRASRNRNLSRLLGPDDQGWYLLQVNLHALAAPAARPAKGNADTWDRLVFSDIGGKGFQLLLDDTVLLPLPKAATATRPAPQGRPNVTAACSGVVCNPLLADMGPVKSKLVPLYGMQNFSVSSADTGPSTLIARLSRGTTAGDVAKLCAELMGELPAAEQQRFKGSCRYDVDPEAAATQDMDAPVGWPFLVVTTESAVSFCGRKPWRGLSLALVGERTLVQTAAKWYLPHICRTSHHHPTPAVGCTAGGPSSHAHSSH